MYFCQFQLDRPDEKLSHPRQLTVNKVNRYNTDSRARERGKSQGRRQKKENRKERKGKGGVGSRKDVMQQNKNLFVKQRMKAVYESI